VEDFIIRDGMIQKADIVWKAWTSGDLNQMLAVLDEPANYQDKHFLLLNIIKETYKLRKDPNWLNVCIEYCKKDIEIFPYFKDTYIENQRKILQRLANDKFTSSQEKEKLLKEAENPPFDLNYSSFERLCIIYEKLNRHNEATEICRLALSYGLTCKTEGGFQARIDKIKKKK
jgi:hypothetical protein